MITFREQIYFILSESQAGCSFPDNLLLFASRLLDIEPVFGCTNMSEFLNLNTTCAGMPVIAAPLGVVAQW
jgi:hypothetical protein